MIPVEAIAEVKGRVELVSFCESQGIELHPYGKGLLGLCPLHPDTNPSFSVDPVKQYWCCLGACSAGGKIVGGDVIELARRLWKVGLAEALERLGGRAGTTVATLVPRNGTRPPLRVVPKPGGPPRSPARPALLAQLAAFFHQVFLGSSEAREYAASRGLVSAELLAALPMGFADGSLLERAPEGSQTYEELRGLGLIKTNEEGRHPREFLSGCLVVPLRDLSGNVVSFYGRAINRDQHLYLPGPRRGLVNAQCAATCDELILTESVFDALSFLQAGIPNAVPLYGTNGWTPDHDGLLTKYRIRRVVLALDSDEAGRKAAASLATKLRIRGIAVLDVVIA